MCVKQCVFYRVLELSKYCLVNSWLWTTICRRLVTLYPTWSKNSFKKRIVLLYNVQSTIQKFLYTSYFELEVLINKKNQCWKFYNFYNSKSADYNDYREKICSPISWNSEWKRLKTVEFDTSIFYSNWVLNFLEQLVPHYSLDSIILLCDYSVEQNSISRLCQSRERECHSILYRIINNY